MFPSQENVNTKDTAVSKKHSKEKQSKHTDMMSCKWGNKLNWGELNYFNENLLSSFSLCFFTFFFLIQFKEKIYYSSRCPYMRPNKYHFCMTLHFGNISFLCFLKKLSRKYQLKNLKTEATTTVKDWKAAHCEWAANALQ